METLEEVAEKYVDDFEYGIAHPRRVCKNGFIAGVKWNQERSYTEQDMIDFACNYTEERKNKGARALTPELLIKQFKKK